MGEPAFLDKYKTSLIALSLTAYVTSRVKLHEFDQSHTSIPSQAPSTPRHMTSWLTLDMWCRQFVPWSVFQLQPRPTRYHKPSNNWSLGFVMKRAPIGGLTEYTLQIRISTNECTCHNEPKSHRMACNNMAALVYRPTGYLLWAMLTSFSWFTDCDYYNSCKQTNKHILFGAVHKLRGQLGAEWEGAGVLQNFHTLSTGGRGAVQQFVQQINGCGENSNTPFSSTNLSSWAVFQIC